MKPEIRRILVPVDFSECSREALAAAALLHEQFSAQVDLLHVYYAPRTTAHRRVVAEVPGHGTMTLDELARHQAEKELAEFLALPGTPQIPGQENVLVPAGDPYRVILAHAAAGDYDIIVLGTHGTSGVSHFLMGSVAEKVLRHAPCPVLLVHGPAASTDQLRSGMPASGTADRSSPLGERP